MTPSHESVRIDALMETSGVKFGTSGARGLADDMSDRVCYAYTRGFLQHMAAQGTQGCAVGIAGDFRPSSPRIMRACARAVADAGFTPVHCGFIPTPAVAAYGIAHGLPTLMVTGSHIPDDRNGIKFNKPAGEILKDDEEAIRGQTVALPAQLFAVDGAFVPGTPCALPDIDHSAAHAYIERYCDFFPADCLHGLRVGLYEHSSVARDLMKRILERLGAEVTSLGRSQTFIPVDTEAIRPEDVRLAREWSAQGNFDCLLSTDGDGDRPLVADEHGQWLRGDVAGVLCARFLRASAVVTPVSCNTVVERSGWFELVRRTRIGSPFVIDGMQQTLRAGFAPVVGYEANGGFLTADDIERDGRRLAALPTRDAVIVGLSVLLSARERGVPISALGSALPPRFTASDRLKDFSTELSNRRIGAIADKAAAEAAFGPLFGPVAAVDITDGLRVTFAGGEIAHLRPSGNAPELRAYTEADTPERAAEMNRICLDLLSGWRNER